MSPTTSGGGTPASSGDEPAASFDAACQAFSPPGAEGASMADATADARELGVQLVGSGAVETVGVSRCHGRLVLSVGVSSPDPRVPRQGPRGTPVLVYRQGGFTAN